MPGAIPNPDGLRFLILDTYPDKIQKRFVKLKMKQAWTLHVNLLLTHMPEARYDVLMTENPGVSLPGAEELAAYDGVMWTGSVKRVYHVDDPSVSALIELARQAYEVGVPSFGTCWGIQLAAAVAGGTVESIPEGRELGLARKTRLTEAGRAHPMYEGKPPVFDGIVGHRDEITELPSCATLLAVGTYVRIQAIEVQHLNGTFWGLQYHPEFSLIELARIIGGNTKKLAEEGFFATPEEAGLYAERLLALHHNPDRKDLRWQMGIDDDLLDQQVRQREFYNWLKHLVIPAARQRRAVASEVT